MKTAMKMFKKNNAFFPLIAGINIYNHNLKIWQYLGYDGDYKKLNYTTMLDCNATKCIKYDYNENGKVLRKHYSCNLNGENCSYYMIFTYDENGNMTYVSKNTQGQNYHQNLEYDENGNATSGTYCFLNAVGTGVSNSIGSPVAG